MEGSWNGWVYRTGNLGEDNLIKRIFQEVYLGEKFTSYYRLYPLFYKGRGFYLREKLLIEKEILSTLRKKLRMGIASGRPRFEANLALKNFHLLPYFDSVITLDECEAEETRILRLTGKKVKLSKPHPYSVQRTIQEIGGPKPRCGYIGDVVDDMRAARAAKKKWSILAIGFLSGGSKKRSARESLLKAGADFIIDNPKQLLQFVA
jgi:phosphoglycolate phosphatase-like HAD superfamily hydrolase